LCVEAHVGVLDSAEIAEATVAEPKTQKNDASVEAFLNSVADERKRQDSFVLVDLMRDITGAEPAMWGDAIVGFGGYLSTNSAGKVSEWPVVAFSPRKQSLTIYLMDGFEQHEDLLGRLGKHSTGKVCLYIKRLSDVDMTALRDLIELSVAHVMQEPQAEEA